jgi:NAD dependent epimerase/dehydratase family enzyme
MYFDKTKKMAQKIILIAGGTGMIGGELISQIQRKGMYKAMILSRAMTDKSKDMISWVSVLDRKVLPDKGNASFSFFTSSL